MKHKAIFLIAFLVWISTNCMAQQTSGSQVQDLALEDRAAIDALLWIGELYDQPLGIIASDKSITTTHVSVRLSNANFADALAKILSQLPKYESRSLDGVVFITPFNRDVATEKLFTMVLPAFESPKAAPYEVSDLLWMEIESRLDPSIKTFVMGDPVKDLTKIQPIRLSDVSVQDVLNELIRKRHSAAWVGFSAPEILNGVARQRLWSIVTYEDPPVRVEDLCCLDRTSLLFAK